METKPQIHLSANEQLEDFSPPLFHVTLRAEGFWRWDQISECVLTFLRSVGKTKGSPVKKVRKFSGPRRSSHLLYGKTPREEPGAPGLSKGGSGDFIRRLGTAFSRLHVSAVRVWKWLCLGKTSCTGLQGARPFSFLACQPSAPTPPWVACPTPFSSASLPSLITVFDHHLGAGMFFCVYSLRRALRSR